MPLPNKAKSQLTGLKHIERLDLKEWGLDAKDMDELVKLIQQNGVKIDYLNLYRNCIDDEGAKFLAQLTDVSVGYLNVCYCDISDIGAIALFRSKIKEIDISDNDLTDESVDIFLREGKQTHLMLNRNRRISQEKMLAADKKLEQNKREAETVADTSSSTWLSSFSLYKYRGTSSSNKTEALPTIEINVEGHPVNISNEEAKQLMLSIMECFLQQSSSSDKQLLQELKDTIEQRIIVGANKTPIKP